jgi:hypothetical protein
MEILGPQFIVTREDMAQFASNPALQNIDLEMSAFFIIFFIENDEESRLKHTISRRIFGNLAGYKA